MTEMKQVRRRPGGRAPLDTGKLRAAYDDWASADRANTMRELARRTGLRVQHISGVLAGKHGISPRSLRQITVELEVPYGSVLADDDGSKLLRNQDIKRR